MNLTNAIPFSNLLVENGETRVLVKFDYERKNQYWEDLMPDDFFLIKNNQGKRLGMGRIFSEASPPDNEGYVRFLLVLIGDHAANDRFKGDEITVESTLPPKEQPANP